MQLRRLVEPALVVVTMSALAAGGIAWLTGSRVAADWCWIAGTTVAVVPAVVWMLAALRGGRLGVDLIAVLSLIGTLQVREYLAGALIAVMLAGGRALDAGATRRASHDLRALLERAPRFARRRAGSEVSLIPLAEVVIDDRLVVGPGEVVPVDGRIVDTVAVLDESALTGEPLQVERGVGELVRSGVVNAGNVFELTATATAENSTYAGIVRLAAQAGADNAPIVRLADRYAAWFLPFTLLLAGAAWWTSGSAVRAVAVLVVATPCPLLLAAPVAIPDHVMGRHASARQHVPHRPGRDTHAQCSGVGPHPDGVARAGQSHEHPVEPGMHRNPGVGPVGQRQRHRTVAVGQIVDLGGPIRRQQGAIETDLDRVVGLHQIAALRDRPGCHRADPGHLRIDQPALSIQHSQLCCRRAEFGSVTDECEQVAGQVLRPGHPSEYQRIDLLVEQRRTRGRVRGRQISPGVLQVGLGGIVSPGRQERRRRVATARHEGRRHAPS